MYANRISYWLNLKGPSITMDGSCCGTLLALEKARDAITSGICEAAIVGSGKLILHPQTSINSNR
jgi:acyl transferase domain-containing protein